MSPMDLAVLAQLGDCEAIHEGWLKQPINAWSSLVFSAVGVAIVIGARSAVGRRERIDRVVFGLLLIATGVGSFFFHGSRPAAAHFLHDVTFLGSLLFLMVANVTGAFALAHRLTGIIAVGGLIVLGSALAVEPGITNALTVVLIVALITQDIALRTKARPARGWYVAALGSLGLAVALFLAGRTGSPLCDPSGPLQAHAGWHAFSAVFLGAYFLATAPARTGGETA